MLLSLAAALLAITLISIAIFHYGFSAYKSVMSPPGILIILGVALLTYSIIQFAITSQQIKEREKFDAALVQIFGKKPDELQLTGDTLSTFTGTAVVNGKRYTLRTEIDFINRAKTGYNIIATPIDGPK